MLCQELLHLSIITTPLLVLVEIVFVLVALDVAVDRTLDVGDLFLARSTEDLAVGINQALIWKLTQPLREWHLGLLGCTSFHLATSRALWRLHLYNPLSLMGS